MSSYYFPVLEELATNAQIYLCYIYFFLVHLICHKNKIRYEKIHRCIAISLLFGKSIEIPKVASLKKITM